MESIDPVTEIKGATNLIDEYGEWPDFYESIVRRLDFYLEDYGAPEQEWLSPSISAVLEVMKDEHSTFLVELKFHDCDSVNMQNFNYSNVIEELLISKELKHNGSCMQNFLRVQIGTPDYTVALSLMCKHIEVLSCQAFNTA